MNITFPLAARLVLTAILLILVELRGQAANANSENSARPNIILVLVNDLRWDETGYAGHPFLQTPHIDRLAREGARFESAFVTTPNGTASFAGVLNGRHPGGFAENGESGLMVGTAFPRVLRDAGYRTFFAGLWPVADEPGAVGFAEWTKSEGGYNPKGHVTDLLTARTIQFIEEKDPRPYCVVLVHHALHVGSGESQLPAADRHRGLYVNVAPRRRPGPEVYDNPRKADARRANVPANSDDHIRNRWRALAAIDDGIGRIYESLQAARQLESTVIMFTSDQGYLYGEHGRTGPNDVAYEEAIRVPLVVYYPKLVKPGTAPSQMVLNIDLAPTIFQLAQLPVPPAVSSQDGTSLVGLLRGKPDSWRTAFLIEGRRSQDGAQPRPYQAVRTAAWKYIRFFGLDAGEELYDFHADHYELINLADRPTAKNELRRWSAELAKVLRPKK